MMLDTKRGRWASALLLAAVLGLQACDDKAAEAPAQPAADEQAASAFAPITVTHGLGETVIGKRPERVAALDMNEVDFLDQLGVPVAGTVKDFVPHFLKKYKDDEAVADLGFIVKPNLESVHALKPDLILISPLQAQHYEELSSIAPTIHFDVDYRNSANDHVEVVKEHLATLGQVFGKEKIADEKAASLDKKLEDVKQVTKDRPEKALIVMHNNGAFSSFGVQSRYGFVFDAFGVKPASEKAEAGLHGQPISSEFIQETNPDILFIIDRTAVMEQRPTLNAETMGNPLLRQTEAWKNGRVIFVDAEAWYVTAASVTSLELMIDDVIRGYGE
ncbi:siderophore ABC transporter substrate-binding protein [Nitratireductor aquibiodomus]|nr:siderophore ABC transporter substrate-binding protein [Nitratireductor aquibiodomus]